MDTGRGVRSSRWTDPRLVRWVLVTENRLVVAVATVAVGVIPRPITLFTASVLRAAAIGRRTVAVGSFVPPRGS